MTVLTQTLFSLVFSLGYAVIYGIRGRTLFYAAIGGVIAWVCYYFLTPYSGIVLANFWAAIAFSIYAELMARFVKKPATLFQVVALLPLVPGGTIYSAMHDLVEGNTEAAGAGALRALSIAAVLALGVVIVSSVTRVFKQVRRHKPRKL